MAITLTSNFTVNIASPIDDRFQVADTTARDAIASGRRYEGLTVYVIADGLSYQLVGGITNGDWVEAGGGGGGGVLVVADLTARNAIDAGDRYEGLLVYVEAEELNFQLQGGILDANWVEVLSGPPYAWGSRGTPMDIIAATGIDSSADKMSTTRLRQLLFVAGDAAGENDISANPQISAHTIVGAEMRIIGRSNADYIKLNNGSGLDLAGGDPWYGFEGNSLDLVWDGTSWFETNRRG